MPSHFTLPTEKSFHAFEASREQFCKHEQTRSLTEFESGERTVVRPVFFKRQQIPPAKKKPPRSVRGGPEERERRLLCEPAPNNPGYAN
jgi:hypothetical protein